MASPFDAGWDRALKLAEDKVALQEFKFRYELLREKLLAEGATVEELRLLLQVMERVRP